MEKITQEQAEELRMAIYRAFPTEGRGPAAITPLTSRIALVSTMSRAFTTDSRFVGRHA